MSGALFIVLESEIPGFDGFVDGKALSKAEADLAAIAADLGIQPLMNFFAAEPAMLEDFFAEEELAGPDFPAPEMQWHEAGAGLKSAEGLLEYLAHHPNALRNADKVMTDLRDFVRVLKKAEQHGVRWYLSVDY
jgi:hypothetical protein